MTRIFISDDSDDRNDGLTRETAIYSWQQAVKLCDGNTETNLMQGCHIAKACGGNRQTSKEWSGPIAPFKRV